MRKYSRLIIYFLIISMLFVGTAPAYGVQNAVPSLSISAYDPSTPYQLTASNLHAQCAVLINPENGEILFQKNATKAMYPASTTKILTALLVLENCDLSQIVTCSVNATQTEASWIPVMYGEQYTIEQLLHALLMKSANDAAIALAEAVAGSVAAFSEMMNARAAAIGCTNSNFCTPNGLPNPNHYTTAYDMALIAAEALKNEDFCRIMQTQTYELPATNKRDTPVTIRNTNKFLSTSGDDSFSYPYGIGMKTGYTNAAQSAFAGAAEKDGMRLVSVVFGTTQEGKWLDTIKLMDYGFATITPFDFLTLYNNNRHNILVSGAEVGQTANGLLQLDIAEYDVDKLAGFYASGDAVTAAESNWRSYITVAETSNVKAPVQKGQVLATLTLQTPFMKNPVTVDLVATKDVEAAAAPAPVTGNTASPTEPDASGIDEPVPLVPQKDAATQKIMAIAFLGFACLALLLMIFILIGAMRQAKKRRAREKRRRAMMAQQYYNRRY